MTKSLFILISSLCFFAVQETKPRFYNWNKPPSIKSYLPGLPTPETPGKRMWIALVTGDRKSLKKDERQLFLRLGMTHIFTPSGMHLTTLTLLLSKGRIFKIMSAILGVFLGVINLFPAMGRVLFLKSSSRSFVPFCLVMILEGILFSWQRHDISWICSWLFLGFCYFSPTSHRALWFSLGQMLLCHIFFQEWSVIGILMNVLMMGLLQVIFPMALLFSLLPKLPPNLLVDALDLIYVLFISIDKIHNSLIPTIPHIGHLLLMLLWILLQGKYRITVLPVLLLLLSSPLNEQKISSFTQSKWEGVTGGTVRCKFEWRNQRWEERCRSLMRAAK